MRVPRVVVLVVALAVAGALAAPAQEESPPGAENPRTLRFAAFLGLGGAPSGDPEDGLDHGAFQLALAWETERDTLVGVRLGQLAIGGDGLSGNSDPDLTYLTVAGEYLFREGYYTSGAYLGVGWYDLDGGASDSSLGVALGVTGDFEVSDRASVLVELSGHYADLDAEELFVMLHVGFGYRF